MISFNTTPLQVAVRFARIAWCGTTVPAVGTFRTVCIEHTQNRLSQVFSWLIVCWFEFDFSGVKGPKHDDKLESVLNSITPGQGTMLHLASKVIKQIYSTWVVNLKAKYTFGFWNCSIVLIRYRCRCIK